MIKKILIIIISCLLFIGSVVINIILYKNYTINYIDTYVASHQISQRTKISDDDLVCISVPKEYLQNDVYIDKDEILNKYVKLGYNIPKGSLIYKTSLEENIKDLANTLLDTNEVNYDIYTSDIKINTANLNRNMCIDLYLTINNNNILVSDLLIKNARITGLYDNNSKQIMDFDNDSKVHIISIAINKEYVNYLNKARMIGEISSVISQNTYDYDECSINHDSILFSYIE